MKAHLEICGWNEDLQEEICNHVRAERLFVQIIEMKCSERGERRA